MQMYENNGICRLKWKQGSSVRMVSHMPGIYGWIMAENSRSRRRKKVKGAASKQNANLLLKQEGSLARAQ
jgi:hypothetical protein